MNSKKRKSLQSEPNAISLPESKLQKHDAKTVGNISAFEKMMSAFDSQDKIFRPPPQERGRWFENIGRLDAGKERGEAVVAEEGQATPQHRQWMNFISGAPRPNQFHSKENNPVSILTHTSAKWGS